MESGGASLLSHCGGGREGGKLNLAGAGQEGEEGVCARMNYYFVVCCNVIISFTVKWCGCDFAFNESLS